MPRLQHVSIPRPPGPESAELARAFYSGIIGLETKPVPVTIEQLDLVWFTITDDVELHVFAEDSLEDPSGRHFCLVVDDLEQMRQKLVAAQYEPWEPEMIRGRPRFFCRDPFSNIVEFTHIEADYTDFQ